MVARGIGLTSVITSRYGDNMIRTQISLEADAYRQAKAAARRQGISMAEFLRRAVAVALGTPRGKSDRPWLRYAGVVASGDAKASHTVNAVVYDRPRP